MAKRSRRANAKRARRILGRFERTYDDIAYGLRFFTDQGIEYEAMEAAERLRALLRRLVDQYENEEA